MLYTSKELPRETSLQNEWRAWDSAGEEHRLTWNERGRQRLKAAPHREEGVVMVCGGGADAALQGEEHCSARGGGRNMGLKVRMPLAESVMDGNISIRTVMTSQAHHRE